VEELLEVRPAQVAAVGLALARRDLVDEGEAAEVLRPVLAGEDRLRDPLEPSLLADPSVRQLADLLGGRMDHPPTLSAQGARDSSRRRGPGEDPC
jgi:hypothetical protein